VAGQVGRLLLDTGQGPIYAILFVTPVAMHVQYFSVSTNICSVLLCESQSVSE